MGERGSDLKSMAARDIVRGAEGHVNGELLKELRIDAGEEEDTDEMSSSFKARLHSCTCDIRSRSRSRKMMKRQRCTFRS